MPVSREKQVLYYYKPYVADAENMPSLATPPPAERTLYVVHFLQSIEESFLLKTFGKAGKIKKTIIGSYQPKRVARRSHKARTLYYALIVYKTQEALEKLKNSKFLQKQVNSVASKRVGFEANPFLVGEDGLVPNESDEDDDLDDDEREKKRAFLEHKRRVEADGFTMVTMDDVNQHRKRGKDSYGTVVEGITEDEMKRLV